MGMTLTHSLPSAPLVTGESALKWFGETVTVIPRVHLFSPHHLKYMFAVSLKSNELEVINEFATTALSRKSENVRF